MAWGSWSTTSLKLVPKAAHAEAAGWAGFWLSLRWPPWRLKTVLWKESCPKAQFCDVFSLSYCLKRSLQGSVIYKSSQGEASMYPCLWVGFLFSFALLLIWIFLKHKLTWITSAHTRYNSFNIKIQSLGMMNWIQIKIHFARFLHKPFFSFFPSPIILIIFLGSLLFCHSS